MDGDAGFWKEQVTGKPGVFVEDGEENGSSETLLVFPVMEILRMLGYSWNKDG